MEMSRYENLRDQTSLKVGVKDEDERKDRRIYTAELLKDDPYITF